MTNQPPTKPRKLFGPVVLGCQVLLFVLLAVVAVRYFTGKNTQAQTPVVEARDDRPPPAMPARPVAAPVPVQPKPPVVPPAPAVAAVNPAAVKVFPPAAPRVAEPQGPTDAGVSRDAAPAARSSAFAQAENKLRMFDKAKDAAKAMPAQDGAVPPPPSPDAGRKIH